MHLFATMQPEGWESSSKASYFKRLSKETTPQVDIAPQVEIAAQVKEVVPQVAASPIS
jgi:hypothetical protein